MPEIHAAMLAAITSTTDRRTIDRLVATLCALAIVPDRSVSDGHTGASKVREQAARFEEWLKEGTESDAQVRRLLLMAVCEKAEDGTSPSRVRSFVKELHKHLTRG